jgi:hypothetical protein
MGCGSVPRSLRQALERVGIDMLGVYIDKQEVYDNCINCEEETHTDRNTCVCFIFVV